MSVGGVFLLVSFTLFFLLGLGLAVLPRAEMFAFASLALGILLVGMPIPPWRLP